jgi:hypothetical protein
MNIIEQNKDKINGILSTFDRMIIKGYILQLCNYRQFLYYLIQNNIKLKNFSEFAQKQTGILCDNINKYISDNNIELQYISSTKIDKGTLALEEFNKDTSKTDLISAFSVVELCDTMTVVPNRETKKLEVASRKTKCKHYYLYYNDLEFGWMFIKIQTWFPYNVQIYINGREYLSKLLDKEGIKYQMYNNSFSYIEDYDKAQLLADSILNKDISSSLDGLIKPINNLLPNIQQTVGHSYYWCVAECEFATDITFKTRSDLEKIYKPLVETSFFTFSSSDIYSFFGRNVSRMHTFSKGEIVSDLRNRYQGYRIKFMIDKNKVKMYDKYNNLRIEVTINNPKDFKILKEKEKIIDHKKIEKIKEWVPMGKSIVNLYRYAGISNDIIKRFINALPEIDDAKVVVKEIKAISERKEINNRIYSGFNILNKETITIFQAIASGDFIIKGFSNKNIRTKIYNDIDQKTINKVTRLLAKLKAHGIIKKVHKRHRYYLTNNGRDIINSILLFINKDLANI